MEKTISENGTDYFAVQRSKDGVNFITIAKVKAAGESYTAKTYLFNDAAPLIKDNYYRLITTDKDGSQKISTVIKLHNRTGADIAIQLQPNPVVSNAQVKIIATTGNDDDYVFTAHKYLWQSSTSKKL